MRTGRLTLQQHWLGGYGIGHTTGNWTFALKDMLKCISDINGHYLWTIKDGI